MKFELMKKLIFAIFLILGQLSYANDSLEISILTCSPGKEVYSVFGHSSIRILDTKNQIDHVYNFGMFDFSTPNFVFKFLKGKLQYFLGIQKTSDFIRIYTTENRTVSEQRLKLTEDEKKEIIKKLHFLYKPENRYYYYSFLNKNCTTELRDILNDIGVSLRNRHLEITYREMIISYLKNNQWLKLGVNLVLGKSLDEKVNSYNSMFLPDFFEKEINDATIGGNKIVKSRQKLNTIQVNNNPLVKRLFSPVIIFSILMLILIFRPLKKAKLLISIFIGGAGLFLAILMLVSEHPELKQNLNIIWCNPLYLLYTPLLIKKKTNGILILVITAGLITSIFIWVFKIQVFDISVIPILIIVGKLNFEELKKWLLTVRMPNK